MSDLDESLKLEQRTTLGKGLGKLHRDGLVPAVIHNHGQPSVHVMGSEVELGKVYRSAGKHHPLDLKVGDDSYLALIKDVHFNPVKHRMQHVVFQAINRDEKVEAEIPLHILEGEIPAIKMGLEIIHQLDHVEVEALPSDLPDSLIVDASKLEEVGDKIMVSDLPVPSGVTILTELDRPIITVVEPKEQVIEEPEAEVVEGEEGAETAEGEGAPAEESAGEATTSENAKE